MAKFNTNSFLRNAQNKDNSNANNNIKTKEALNLASFLNAASQAKKAYSKVTQIELSKVLMNDKNFYSIQDDEIESLAESIRTAGLQQHIIVLDNEDGTYKILTGHKRTLAYQKLAKEDEFYNYIPAVIITKETFNVNLPISDELKEKYLITITNSETRKKTDNDIYQEFLVLKEIYQEAKTNGYKLNDRLRSILADEMNLSAATIGRMEFVQKHATESTKEALANDTISLNQARIIAAEPEEKQKEIITQINETLIEEDHSESSDESEDIPEKTSKKNIMDELQSEHYVVDQQDVSDPIAKAKNLSDNLSDTCSLINEMFVSGNSYDLTKKEYAKLLKLKEDIEKQAEKLEKFYSKMYDIFSALQDNYTN